MFGKSKQTTSNFPANYSYFAFPQFLKSFGMNLFSFAFRPFFFFVFTWCLAKLNETSLKSMRCSCLAHMHLRVLSVKGFHAKRFGLKLFSLFRTFALPFKFQRFEQKCRCQALQSLLSKKNLNFT